MIDHAGGFGGNLAGPGARSLYQDLPAESSQFGTLRPTNEDSNWWLGSWWHNHLSIRPNIIRLYPNRPPTSTAVSVAIA